MDRELQLMVGTAWLVLSVVGRWLLFRKAGKPGWHSLIPIVNMFDEYDICWHGGNIFVVALLAAFATGCGLAGQEDPVLLSFSAVAVLWLLGMHWRESMKLAAAFGKGRLYGLFLFLFDRFGRVVLGLSSAEYVGKEGSRVQRTRSRCSA